MLHACVRTCVCAHACAHMHMRTCTHAHKPHSQRPLAPWPPSASACSMCQSRSSPSSTVGRYACMHMHTHACSCIHLTSSTRYLRCMHLRLRISCMIHLTSSTHYLRCTCMFAYVYPACVYAYMQARLRAARVSYVDDGCVSGHRLALGRSLTHTCTCACVHTCIHTFAGERRRAAVGRSL